MQPFLPAGVRVPGSTANLGPGFDTFGLALELYLEAWVFAPGADRPLVRCGGPHGQGIALDGSNLVLAAFRRAFECAGQSAPEVCLELWNEIPLVRGLGSSGAAIIAGIELADRSGRLCMTGEAKLALASELEYGHADNVGASLLGGFVIACNIEGPGGNAVRVVSFPWPSGIELVAAIPEAELKTEKARALLPAAYSRQDVVFNLQRVAMLAALLTAGARAQEPASCEKLSHALADRLHQPYRAPLVPGMKEALELKLPGLLGVALSGAGPALLVFVSSHRAEVTAALRAIYAKLGISCEVRPIGVAAAGVTALATDELRMEEMKRR